MKNFKNSKYYAIIIAIIMIFTELTGITGITDNFFDRQVDTRQEQAIDREEINSTSDEDMSTSQDNNSSSEDTSSNTDQTSGGDTSQSGLQKNQAYYSKEDVSNYLIEFGELPPNYLTKDEARDLGWEASEGNLWDVTDRGVIGGDNFGNFEGLLPNKSGRRYFEADVNYNGGRRNAERLVYSNDGLIYYTSDHYGSFEEIIGE